MAEFIPTRTSLQCRSHHQKFLEKLGEIKKIIHNFKKYMTKEEFKQRYQEALDMKKEGSLNTSSATMIKVEQASELDSNTDEVSIKKEQK